MRSLSESPSKSRIHADLVGVYQLGSTTREAEFIAVARTALAVLTGVEPDQHARALLLLAWESDRLIDVLEKQMAGIISQTDFESFLHKRRWPAEIIQRILALDSTGRSHLLNALRAQDYFAVAFIFMGVRNPFDSVASSSGEPETRQVVD